MGHDQIMTVLCVHGYHFLGGAGKQLFHHGGVSGGQGIFSRDGFFSVIGFSGTLPDSYEGFHLFKWSEGGMFGSGCRFRDDETAHNTAHNDED